MDAELGSEIEIAKEAGKDASPCLRLLLALPPNLGTKESRIGIYTHSEAHDASEEISEEVRFPLGTKILVSF